MAGSLNKATLIGNCGADPEIRSLDNGSRVANFSLATSESWKDKNTGEKKERTEWHRIVVWNDGLIGVIEQYVKKGSKLYIEGEIQTRKWQDQTGNDRYSTEIVMTGFGGRLILLGDSGGGSATARDPNDNASRPGNQTQKSYADESGGNYSRDLDDEIPF